MKAFEDFWRLYLAQQFGTTDGAEEETVEKATARAIWLAARTPWRPIASAPEDETIEMCKLDAVNANILWVATGELEEGSRAVIHFDCVDEDRVSMWYTEPTHWRPFDEWGLVQELTGEERV